MTRRFLAFVSFFCLAAAQPALPQAAPAIPQPHIDSIRPEAPVIQPNEPLTLVGSGFQDKVAVTLTDPEGNSTPAQVLSIDPKRLIIVATLGSAGAWKVSARNPNGPESPQLSFPVANTAAFNLPGALAFLLAALVATALLAGLLAFMLRDVKKAQDLNQWSLGDALSEESAYQPKEIKQKSDVILFASTSRLIALIGLMGILAVVVGMGYSIMWNLFVYGTVPDLSQVRSFLLGSATLFAPYLANQISSAFTPSAKVAAGGDAAGVAITGIAPAEPGVDPAAQTLHLIGTGFQPGLSLTITDPAGAAQTVSGADITANAPTQVSASVTMNLPGTWKISAANPGGAACSPLMFTVFGPPTITGVTPAGLRVNAAGTQPLTFAGTGFISSLKVVLTPPAGAAPITVKADSVTSTSVAVQAALTATGPWSAVITNPHGHASAARDFTVDP